MEAGKGWWWGIFFSIFAGRKKYQWEKRLGWATVRKRHKDKATHALLTRNWSAGMLLHSYYAQTGVNRPVSISASCSTHHHFLDASSHPYMKACPSDGPSVLFLIYANSDGILSQNKWLISFIAQGRIIVLPAFFFLFSPLGATGDTSLLLTRVVYGGVCFFLQWKWTAWKLSFVFDIQYLLDLRCENSFDMSS